MRRNLRKDYLEPVNEGQSSADAIGVARRPMRIVFTKGPDKYDRMDVVRTDGTIERIDCPKQRIIPHDMVHYAVESTLVKRGFLARVRDGEHVDMRMRGEAESDGVERLVEVIQGDAWSGGTSHAIDMLDLYRVTCSARACPMLDVTEHDIDAVRARMAELTEQWDALAVGQSLTLSM